MDVTWCADCIRSRKDMEDWAGAVTILEGTALCEHHAREHD